MPPETLKCPSVEWSHYEGSCYQAYGTGKELSWNEAQDFCVSQGGNLLSVGSEEEEHEVLYRFIFDEMRSSPLNSVKIRTNR